MTRKDLNNWRKELGIGRQYLVRRTGLSRATVDRVLSGQKTSSDYLLAVGSVLGLKVVITNDPEDPITISPKGTADDIRREHARETAKYLVGLTQGTMSLEGQGLGQAGTERLVEDSMHRLLAGSNRKLWR
jgi:hypothetical protein